MLNGLVTAVRTLTIFPVPGQECGLKRDALPWFALVGLVIGTLQFICGSLVLHYASSLAVFIGLFLAGINYLITGALHLDGLADTADAFGTFHTREKTLGILKDPHIGTFGVLALVSIVIWRIIACYQLGIGNGLYWLILCCGSSRAIQAVILSIIPYAREKEGKAFGFGASAAMAVFLSGQFIMFPAVSGISGELLMFIVPFCTGALMTVPVLWMFIKRIGGITGDGIGAVTEVYEVFFLTAAVMAG